MQLLWNSFFILYSMKKLRFILIKPSLYDDDGFVIRFSKGVLPSNTLTVIYGLLDFYLEKFKNKLSITYHIEIYDEIVDKINIKKSIKKILKNKEEGIIFIVGVQTNQFIRATDLAIQFRELGFKVFLGGFHVSGILSVFTKPDESLLNLINKDISIVAGEVEETLPIILDDIISSKIKKIYNFLHTKPDLTNNIMPKIPEHYLKKFAVKNFSTLDCGRGCPYRCSFCTIINVHGNIMRYRDVDTIKEYIIQNYKKNKINYYFFTDDNFARNKKWKEILNAIIHIKKEYKIPIRFMIQVDTLAYKIPDFIPLLKEAGCTQVFVGMESLNPENLKDAGKRQNKIDDFNTMIKAWNYAGISVHTGYIIGFSKDTTETIKKDIQTLTNQLQVQQASFFILTPLPGSQDHKNMLEKNLIFDLDYNHYDSFHLVWKHPYLTPQIMKKIYKYCWNYFYSLPQLFKKIWNSHKYSSRISSNMLGNYLWYKYSLKVNHFHPMVSGFHRKKSYFEKRSSIPTTLKGFFIFYFKRFFEILIEIVKTTTIVLEFFILYGFYYIIKIFVKSNKQSTFEYKQNASSLIFRNEKIITNE